MTARPLGHQSPGAETPDADQRKYGNHDAAAYKQQLEQGKIG